MVQKSTARITPAPREDLERPDGGIIVLLLQQSWGNDSAYEVFRRAYEDYYGENSLRNKEGEIQGEATRRLFADYQDYEKSGCVFAPFYVLRAYDKQFITQP